ncbi:ABC transporter permease [Acetivibrio clariflavus]|uniref:Permease component of ribose/xylose/arabinose/galactoside ABC-type transporters n=1 Tax=Acetivibrio clariflavus (strain DSM 19732 / NBRC 101661 / EBR45) TaxID=720554 RepID=G8LVS4_ACECE|nr:ABC transporter permease [Acetivibrio clariflavus]AEV67491.1 permease component of ribose/xylose/arabinose/galactoside ABC-type transporters [Acetivibrio clariflavus DSM 19732]
MEKKFALPFTKGNKSFKEFGVLMVLLGIVVVLSIVTPSFLRPQNIINVIRQMTEIGVMAIGMTMVIICAEIDLSVGSIYGATAMIAALMIKSGISPTLAFIVSLCIGALIGFVNGFLSTKAKMPAFIVTLGTMQIFRSIAYAVSGGKSIGAFSQESQASWVFGIGGNIGPIPLQIIIMIILYIVTYVVMKKTRVGFNIYATGGNKRAASLAGIDTDRMKIISFVSMGILSAFAGMISIAYLKSVPTTAGSGREMDVIAAVILGGTSMNGGRGSILGTFIGATIMAVVRNGMVLLSVPAFWQSGFIGIIIIVAVLMDTWITQRKSVR